ncbi:unnamed protein product [Porites lobata]|uniref:Protein kinase domain-containing protein n=1 Tax=Porites lobata TaxID=104759 RepID=A0ABN8RLL6_9CNID|nr:unnamed protein product [Porites lobata]
MNIASKCRHPHLLQYIGATNDEGNPLFVTELMEKSLRALLEQRQLAEIEVRVISVDVARAINYLHQKKPEPIIHRDVSSANVLLWRQGDQWRGKVSDYGTANFMQQTMTVAPGAMIYSAPEALTSNQTAKSRVCISVENSPNPSSVNIRPCKHRKKVFYFFYNITFLRKNAKLFVMALIKREILTSRKVDVYSFGVLLCEMCIRELPDPRRREQQVLLITNRVLRGLVRRCLQTDPEARPTMQDIIGELSRAV